MNGSWRTTTTGILTIIVAFLTAALSFLKTGTLDPVTLGAIGTAISGLTGLFARDKVVTSEQQGIK